VLWFGFFILNASTVLFLYFTDQIEGDNFRFALFELNSLYTPYVGAIAAYYLARTRLPGRASRRLAPLLVAIAATGVWNGLIAAQMIRLVAGTALIEVVIGEIRDFTGALAWLVAPALGYYFARQAAAQNDADA
jgi:hypothetical protein